MIDIDRGKSEDFYLISLQLFIIKGCRFMISKKVKNKNEISLVFITFSKSMSVKGTSCGITFKFIGHNLKGCSLLAF